MPPGELEGRLERKARQLGRELKLPGFRRGKVPAPLVIQRIGREAVLEEAVRDTLSSWYSDAIESAGIVPVGDPQLDLGELPAAGRGARVLDRDRRAAEGRARRVQGPRGRRAASPTVDDEQIAAGDRGACASAWRAWRPPSAPPPRATSSWSTTSARSLRDGLRGEDVRPGSRSPGGEGRDQLVELGAGNLIPGFEEGAARRERRRDAHGRADLPRRLRQRASSPGATPSSRSPSRRSSSRSCPRSTTTSRSTPASTTSRSCARTSASACSRPSERARRGRVPPGRARRGRGAGARCRSRPSSSRRARGRCGSGCCTRSPTAGSRARPTCRSPAARSRTILAEMEPEAELALRREAVITAVVAAEEIEPVRGGAARGARADRRARGRRAAEAARASCAARGRLEEVREDLAARQAIDLIAERGQADPARAGAGARAAVDAGEGRRERAGRRRRGAAPGKLWTPTDRGSAS